MSKRVLLLYSQSDHFPRAVEAMRAAHPDTTLTVLLPAGRDDLETGLPAGVESVALPAAGGMLGQVRGIVRAMRSMSADALCVLYPSPNLRILAAMSGARERCWCGEDGKLRPLDETIARVLAALAWQRLRGELRYAWLWVLVRCTRGAAR